MYMIDLLVRDHRAFDATWSRRASIAQRPLGAPTIRSVTVPTNTRSPNDIQRGVTILAETLATLAK